MGFSKSDWRLDLTADRSRNSALHYLEKDLMREKKLALLHLTSDWTAATKGRRRCDYFKVPRDGVICGRKRAMKYLDDLFAGLLLGHLPIGVLNKFSAWRSTLPLEAMLGRLLMLQP